MPTPRKGESKEDFIKRYMSSDEAKKDFPDEKQRYAVALSTWKKSKGESMKDWRHIEFYVPFEVDTKEAVISKEELPYTRIKGVAINSTITRNGVGYAAEELRKSASGLKNKPLLKDHTNSVDSIIGRVTDSRFNEMNKNIEFEAMIMDDSIRRKVEQGLINNVSIGAMVSEIEETDEALMAKGIQFVELSLVAVPGDPGAMFDITHALRESYELRKSQESLSSITDENNFNQKEVINMEESEFNEMKTKLEKAEKELAEVTQKLKLYKEVSEEITSKLLSKVVKEQSDEDEEEEEVEEKSKIETKEEVKTEVKEVVKEEKSEKVEANESSEKLEEKAKEEPKKEEVAEESALKSKIVSEEVKSSEDLSLAKYVIESSSRGFSITKKI